jgi:hypothetical protein
MDINHTGSLMQNQLRCYCPGAGTAGDSERGEREHQSTTLPGSTDLISNPLTAQPIDVAPPERDEVAGVVRFRIETYPGGCAATERQEAIRR